MIESAMPLRKPMRMGCEKKLTMNPRPDAPPTSMSAPLINANAAESAA